MIISQSQWRDAVETLQVEVYMQTSTYPNASQNYDDQ